MGRWRPWSSRKRSVASARLLRVLRQPDPAFGQADVLISEPMGFMLFHEQMLDSFVLARQKFLRYVAS